MKAPLNWLRDFVEISLPHEELATRLTMAGLEVVSLNKVEGDIIFDIELTPNRSDCLSIVGLAREVAAATGKKMKLPYTVKALKPDKAKSDISVRIEAPKLCPRYTLRRLSGIKVAPSPKWLADRLTSCDQRCINNVVDITNYLLLESGLPMHAFDRAQIRGRNIEVRRAKAGERLLTIDGIERPLIEDDLVIADEAGPIALAGIIGGKEAEISSATKDILLECAYFDPVTIRRTAARLGLTTESSYRFERGIDIGGILDASSRAVALILDLSGGEESGTAIDKGRYTARKAASGNKEKAVKLRASFASRILGVSLSLSQIRGLLNRLGFRSLQKTRDEILVTVPPFRRDIEKEIDLVEEIARLYTYDRIPSISRAQIRISPRPVKSNVALSVDRAKNIFISQGFNEIISYSLVSRQEIERISLNAKPDILAIRNPLSAEGAVLRRSLVPGILKALAYNINRGCARARIFELGAIYIAHQRGAQYPETKPMERLSLGIGLAGSRYNDWLRGEIASDFFDLKGAVEVFLDEMGIEGVRFTRGGPQMQGGPGGEEAQLFLKAQAMGVLFEVPRDIRESFDIAGRVFVAELDFEGLLESMNLVHKYIPPPKFPSVFRDIAIVVKEEVAFEEVRNAIGKFGEGLIKRVELFDQYIGPQISEGMRSLAYRIEYAHPERTLTDQEVGALQDKIISALQSEFGALLR